MNSFIHELAILFVYVFEQTEEGKKKVKRRKEEKSKLKKERKE